MSTIDRIKAKIKDAEERQAALNEAFAMELSKLQTALQVVAEMEPEVSFQPKASIFDKSTAPQIEITNAQAVLKSLNEFGRLDTNDLLVKVNQLKKNPTTLKTIGVMASNLKKKGQIDHNGRTWGIKLNKALPKILESASKVTGEATTSPNESLGDP